jgi:hypothetical protein
MDKVKLLGYLEKLDGALQSTSVLFIYGSVAFILLDEPDRTSLDIDVAAPYSKANEEDLRRAAEAAGLPVNPDEDYDGDHIEWIGPLRLCFRQPDDEKDMVLWRGKRLVVVTGSAADLIASKLIRYDDLDRSDIMYLVNQGRVSFAEIESAAARLPPAFSSDPLVRENLANLAADMKMWKVQAK